MKSITEQVLLGSMCGDGCISHKSKNPIYQEIHSIKQEDYVLWKYNLMKELNPRVYYGESSSQQGKFYKTIGFNSPANKELLKYRNMFYVGRTGEKRISYRVLKMLKPIALAVWYMDDGNYNYGDYSVVLSSCMNDINIQKTMKNYFEKYWGLDCVIQHAREGLDMIRFTRSSSDKFLKIIEKYIPDSMSYKLGHLRSSNFKKIDEFKIKSRKTKKIYREENAEVINKYMKKYRLDNRDKINEWHRNHYEENKEEISAKHNEYNLSHKEEIAEHGKKYRAENKEKIVARGKEYRAKNKDKEYERHHNYYIKNKDKIKAKHKQYYIDNKKKWQK